MEHLIATLLEVFCKERKRFNLYEDEMAVSIKELSSTFIENFDVPYERCAYMYNYSICHFYFFKDCISDFFNGYEGSKALLEGSGWRCPNLSSLSFGPGLDFLAFISAIVELDPKPSIIPNFKNVHILTKHGAWRNTVNLLSDAIYKARESKKINKNINFQGLNVLQVNIFSNFKEDAVEILKNSDFVLIFKFLNWTGTPGEQGNSHDTLNELASNIKPGAVVFFIDTMPSCCMMKDVLSEFNGTYLYGPVKVNYRFPHEFPEQLFKIFGKNPIKSARGVFFVWQKYIPKLDFRQSCSNLKITDRASSLTQNIASINEKSIKVSSSDRSSTSNLDKMTPSAPENKGFNNKSLESKLVEVTGQASSNILKMKTIDYQESYDSTCSTESSECKEISSEDSNEKDLKFFDKGLQIHQPLKVSKYTQTNSVTDMLSDNQLSIIKSLTDKINNLASSVDNFEQRNRSDDSVATMVSEKLNTIEQLTERINRLVNSLEQDSNSTC